MMFYDFGVQYANYQVCWKSEIATKFVGKKDIYTSRRIRVHLVQSSFTDSLIPKLHTVWHIALQHAYVTSCGGEIIAKLVVKMIKESLSQIDLFATSIV